MAAFVAATFCVGAKETSLHLGLSAGAGAGDFREMGFSPLVFGGPDISAGAQALLDIGRFRVEDATLAAAGIYGHLRSTADGNTAYSVFLRNALNVEYLFFDGSEGRLRLFAGGGIGDCLTGKIVPSFENGSYGVSNFASLNAVFDMEYDLTGRWMLFGGLDLPLATLITRPPYSFIDNFSARKGLLDSLFSSYETSFGMLDGANVSLGAAYGMRNGNRIALSYVWNYATSWNSGVWRVDDGLHILQLTLTFKIF